MKDRSQRVGSKVGASLKGVIRNIFHAPGEVDTSLSGVRPENVWWWIDPQRTVSLASLSFSHEVAELGRHWLTGSLCFPARFALRRHAAGRPAVKHWLFDNRR
jgi:hypothetical protein